MPARVKDRFHTVFLVNDGCRVTRTDPLLGERGEERVREGRQRQPEVGEARGRKKEEGCELVKVWENGRINRR